MPLYKATVEVEFVVYAANQAEADKNAGNCAREAIREGVDIEAFIGVEIRSADQLPDGWDAECLPYGGDGKATIGELLDAALPTPDDKTIDMFGLANEKGGAE